MRGRIERVAEPAAHLVARHDRGQHVAAGSADHLADRERRWNHRRARMQRGIRMGVVEIQRMAERAVEQRGHRRRPGLAVAKHGGFALAVERQRFQHLEQRGRGFRIAPRPDRAAEKIQRQRLGAFQHLQRDVREFQIGDIGGERCGFVGHCRCLARFGRHCNDEVLFWYGHPLTASTCAIGGSDPCFPCARSAHQPTLTRRDFFMAHQTCAPAPGNARPEAWHRPPCRRTARSRRRSRRARSRSRAHRPS